MKNIRIDAVSVGFNPGIILSLSEEQAAARAHCLTELEDGLYLVERRVEFKRGEVVGYDGPMDKALSSKVTDQDAEEKKSEPEKETKTKSRKK